MSNKSIQLLFVMIFHMDMVTCMECDLRCNSELYPALVVTKAEFQDSQDTNTKISLFAQCFKMNLEVQDNDPGPQQENARMPFKEKKNEMMKTKCHENNPNPNTF